MGNEQLRDHTGIGINGNNMIHNGLTADQIRAVNIKRNDVLIIQIPQQHTGAAADI
ncbi:hypothetical protein D3C85_1574420 [compost metagenome]